MKRKLIRTGAGMLAAALCFGAPRYARADEGEPVDAGIFVEKISDLPADFITGADISSYLAEKKSGVKYYDFEGTELDDAGFFAFMADCGLNYVRLRLWNDPKDENGNTYGGGNCDLETVKTIGLLATGAGMRVLIDFHYSDFWADPGKQTAPKAWENLSLEDKCTALEDFTAESLRELLEAGVDVGMVQIGNETNNGIAGETDHAAMCALLSAGSRAVRAVSSETGKDILVALHFTNPEDKTRYEGYAEYLEEYGVDYDVFASSWYPYWHGSAANISRVLQKIAVKYGKKVMIAETSYIHTYEDGDGSGNTESEGKAGSAFPYDISEQGQADLIRTAANAVAKSGDAGIGIFYWEPAWIPVGNVTAEGVGFDEVSAANREAWERDGSGWATSFAGEYDSDAAQYYGGSAVDNEAIFDFDGHPLRSAKTFAYLRTGAYGVKAVQRVGGAEAAALVGSDPELPDTVEVTWNDSDKQKLPVSWDMEAVSAAMDTGVGEYLIPGTVEVDGEIFESSLKLTLQQQNFLANPGFEDADMSAWSLKGNAVSRKDDSNNVLTGKYCLHFWAEEAVDFTAEQTVVLDAGTYRLGASLEGGDAGDQAEMELYACLEGEELTCPTAVEGWRKWVKPEIGGIIIEEDGTELTIGVRVQAAPGAWGAWDDFFLYGE